MTSPTLLPRSPVELSDAGVDAASSRRAMTLLLLFVAGCVVVGAAAAVGLGAVWQELYAWALPQITGDQLVG